MSTTYQHKPEIASAYSLAEATEAAEAKYRAALANPTSERDRKYAVRGLAAIEKFRAVERESVQQ